MKVLAVLMIIVGIFMALGALFDITAERVNQVSFWVSVLAAPAGFFFSGAGLMLLVRPISARIVVLSAALLMVVATLVGTFTTVMGLPATLIGIVSAVGALVWFWQTRQTSVRPA